MTKQQKKSLRLALGLLALLTIGTGIFIYVRISLAPVELVIAHPFTRPQDRVALDSVLADFGNLYRHIKVRSQPLDPEELRGTRLASQAVTADLVAIIGPGSPNSLWRGQPTSWTGSAWVLAARRSTISKLSAESAAFESLRNGSLAPESFAALLGRVQKAGLSPLTLGNSHGWPFLLWLQHWAAATVGPDAVDGLPKADAPADDPWLARLEPAYKTLADWKAKTYFDPKAWDQGWAQGLKPLVEGRALFALLSPTLYSALDAATKNDLEFFPFPGSRLPPAADSKTGKTESRSWTIGSVWALAIPTTSKHPKEAGLLLGYLSSPGVTETLSKRIGRPFFAWKDQPGDLPSVIPDWYGAANSVEMQRLIGRFSPVD